MPFESVSTFAALHSASPIRSSQREPAARASAVPIPFSRPKKTMVSSTRIFLYRPRSSGR